MKAHGTVHKYGDNVDTDVIIPARYLNTADHKELASHCMEDIDKDFVKNVKDGDIIVANMNFGCGSSKRTRTYRNQGKRNFLRYRKHICKNILPQRYQYRTCNLRVRRGCQGY